MAFSFYHLKAENETRSIEGNRPSHLSHSIHDQWITGHLHLIFVQTVAKILLRGGHTERPDQSTYVTDVQRANGHRLDRDLI